MFRHLAAQVVPNGAELLVRLHPAELAGLLEQAWNLRVHNPSGPPPRPTGHPDHRSDTPGIGIPQLPLPVVAPPSLAGTLPGSAQPFSNVLSSTLRFGGVRWHHLIYAYMIAN